MKEGPPPVGDADTYRRLAAAFRVLAEEFSRERTAAALREIADQYDEHARQLDAGANPPAPTPGGGEPPPMLAPGSASN